MSTLTIIATIALATFTLLSLLTLISAAHDVYRRDMEERS